MIKSALLSVVLASLMLTACGNPDTPGGRAADAQLLEMDIRRRQQPQADVAGHAHVAAQDARGLLFQHAAIAVPVDRIRQAEQRRQGMSSTTTVSALSRRTSSVSW